MLGLEAHQLEHRCRALGVRRVVAGRRVGGHAHQLLQVARLLFEMFVDPVVEAIVDLRVGGHAVDSWGNRCWKARTDSSVSLLVMASSGLWLMPALRPRWNSMACGITSCSFIASWPA